MGVLGTFTESPCVPGQMPHCVLGPGENSAGIRWIPAGQPTAYYW